MSISHFSSSDESCYTSSLSSKIDWCEPNYVVCIYIAEFWNTMSNFPFLILPLIMMNLYEAYAINVPHSKYVNIVWVSLLIIGIGSFYFHATLSLLGQVVDEAGILWICCACAGVWMLDRNLPKYLQQNRGIYQIGIGLLTLISTFLGFLKPEINHFFLFLFILPSVAILRQQSKISLLYRIWQSGIHFIPSCCCKWMPQWVLEIIKYGYMLLSYTLLCFISFSPLAVSSPTFQKLNGQCLQIWAFALTSWILDRIFCSFWLSINFPYLHAIWHVLVAYGGYMVCVCFSFCFALEQAPSKQPVLVFKSYFNVEWLGIWYVAFSNSVV